MKATNQINLVLGLILFATLTRIALPPFFTHLPNFSPVDAIGLFCGAYFSRRMVAICIALLSVWVGDIFINKLLLGHWTLFYQGFYWQYGSYVLVTLLGSTLAANIKPVRIASTCFASSILFFLISNFGVWFSGTLYPLTIDGFISCYIAAIPFYKNTLLSDLFFSSILFGSIYLVMGKQHDHSQSGCGSHIQSAR